MRSIAYGALTSLALLSLSTQAQVLPPPPVSPTPVTRYEYDAGGNLTKIVRGAGSLNLSTQANYDPLDRLKASTDPQLGKTQFSYNGQDQLTQVADPRGLLTQTPRNGLGDIKQLNSPDTGLANHTYDEAGNLKTRTDSRGVLASHSYDALNRLTQTTYSQGTSRQSFLWSYDQTGSGFSNGIGRLTSSIHPSGSTQYSHDPFGHVLKDTQRINPAAGANPALVTSTVSTTYNSGGHVDSITYPSGRKLSLSYNTSQLKAIGLASNAGSLPIPLLSNIQWLPFGGVKSWQWEMASGKPTHERVFDLSGRQVRYRLGNLIRDLTYDAANRISAYTHYDAASAARLTALDQSFSYDKLDRLTQTTLATGVWNFSYDANGNRTSATASGSTSNYTTAASSNRLTSISNPSRSFSYDSAGNTTNDGQFSATYDLAGRMVTLSKAGVTTTYSYDGFGRRVRKVSSTGAASTVIFVYDQAGQLLGEYDSTGKAIKEYVWLGDILVAVFMPDPASVANPPLVYFIHTDHLNTPRVIVDKNNAIRWRWMAEPFGVNAPETNPSGLGVFTFNLRFPGQYFDQESGLHYNGFRSYDSSTGRYTQFDPIGLAGGINGYAYVGGNPLRWTDPTGKIAIADDIVIGGGIVIVGCALSTGCRQAVSDAARAAGDACSAGAGRLKDWIFSDGANNGDKDPSTPTGQRGSPIEVEPGTNQPTNIGGRDYSGHALDRMQGRGVPPSAVEDAIRNGAPSPGNTPGTTVHTGSNGVTVVTGTGGRVVTVIPR